jgi:hypothetical protein
MTMPAPRLEWASVDRLGSMEPEFGSYAGQLDTRHGVMEITALCDQEHPGPVHSKLTFHTQLISYLANTDFNALGDALLAVTGLGVAESVGAEEDAAGDQERKIAEIT